MSQTTALVAFKCTIDQLIQEYKGAICMESSMIDFFSKLTARLGIYKPLAGVEIYTTVVGYHVCARRASTNEPLVEFRRDEDATSCINDVVVYSNNLLAWLKSLKGEEVKVENTVEYMSFTEALSKMEVGDIIKASHMVATGIIRIEDEYRYYDIQTKHCGHVVPLCDKVVNAKYELIPAPKYVDWKTAFDAYSSGCTIEGHDPEADHNTTVVIGPHSDLYYLSNRYPSVGFADLDRYQWVIK